MYNNHSLCFLISFVLIQNIITFKVPTLCITKTKLFLSNPEQSIKEIPKSVSSNYYQQIRFTSKLLSIASISLLTAMNKVNAENIPDFNLIRSEIDKIYTSDPNKGPTLVRLSWHASGTYDKMTKTGGSQKGTIRFKEELAHGANAGLNEAVQWLEPIYQKFKSSGLSYADLYTLSGIEAISLMKGPKISWRAGRKDSFDPQDVTPDGRLPDADRGNPQSTADGLRQVFGRMGFNDQEIVALSGAHALGRCHAEASGYVGPWTPTPTTFNNLYYTLLLNLKWVKNETSKKFQYQDPSGKLMMLPSDLVLIQDEKLKKYVELYAKDQNLFFNDFSNAFQKLQELGTSNLYSV